MKTPGSKKQAENLINEWEDFRKNMKIDLWLYGATATAAGIAIAFAVFGIFMGYYLSGIITPIIAVAITIFARITMQKQIERGADHYAADCWQFGRTTAKAEQAEADKEIVKKKKK
jgi:fatty acid desaturase